MGREALKHFITATNEACLNSDDGVLLEEIYNLRNI